MSNDLPVDKINKLAEILKTQQLTEIELETKEFKIKVRKEVSVVAAQAPIQEPVVAKVAAKAPSNLLEVKSPMVGTFYAASSPDAKPFVKVGDKVKKGDPLCIVEAMKLMNELPSEIEGEIVEILVSNGQAISYGQVIMTLKAL